MTIDNQKRIIKLKLWTRFIAFLMVVSILLAIIPAIPDVLFLNIKKIVLAIVFTSIYVLYVLYIYNIDYNYIYFSDENDKIIFRYYSLRPFNELKNSIEMNKKELEKIETQKFFFNQKKKIILFQKTKKGIAKYPPISISSLNSNDRNALLHSLTVHSSLKK